MALQKIKLSLATLLMLFSVNATGQYGQYGQSAEPPRRPGDIVCCVDSSGQRACGDILPQRCQGRSYIVYNKYGLRVREVAAPMSHEEKMLITLQEEQKKKEEEAAMEKRRQDSALLASYADLAEIDRAQSQAESRVKKDIGEAEAKIAEAKGRIQTLKEASGDTASTSNEDMEVRYQTELIKLKQQELQSIRKKYNDDRQRYKDILNRSRASSKR